MVSATYAEGQHLKSAYQTFRHSVVQTLTHEEHRQTFVMCHLQSPDIPVFDQLSEIEFQ